MSAVRARYRQGGQESDFLRIVGDGTLWLALLNGLASLPWKGRNGPFEKALALRSTFRAEELLASADAGRMRSLVARLVEKRLRASTLADARLAAEHLDLLEAKILEKWICLIEAQEIHEIVHQPGDLLWRDQAGWATAQEERLAKAAETVEVYLHLRSRRIGVRAAGFYVNVTRAAKQDPDVGVLFEAVQMVGAGSPGPKTP